MGVAGIDGNKGRDDPRDISGWMESGVCPELCSTNKYCLSMKLERSLIYIHASSCNDLSIPTPPPVFSSLSTTTTPLCPMVVVCSWHILWPVYHTHTLSLCFVDRYSVSSGGRILYFFDASNITTTVTMCLIQPFPYSLLKLFVIVNKLAYFAEMTTSSYFYLTG
jgi:hypothetical protein